jgi:hypothetical protein
VLDSNPDVLSELLDDELNADPTTKRNLTNHLPMALVAKTRLGANEGELRRFAAAYSKRNAPLAPVQHPLTSNTWTTAIGQKGASGDLRDYFSRSVNDVGVDNTLRAHLPFLLPGISGAAFHGAIRLAYALEVASPIRIAAGLGYLAEVAPPLGPITPSPATLDDPIELLITYSRSHRWSSAADDNTIGERMSTVAHDEAFMSLPAALHLDEHTADRLADAALAIFATTGDFTALHGVTGSAAIESLRPWLDDPSSLDLYLFQALAAAYLTIDAPALWSGERQTEFVASNNTTLGEVELVGANSDDEHVSKLIYTAHRLWVKTANPLYLAVAARKARLLPQVSTDN